MCLADVRCTVSWAALINCYCCRICFSSPVVSVSTECNKGFTIQAPAFSSSELLDLSIWSQG
uniref:Uncharacterized protein n=1 Tax=Arundo donax TaxID=35708 RepID=A0A0A9C6K7_ARUDO